MIEIKNVSKKFEDFVSVNDVSFQVERGTVCGLVGTNGAGKSTLLRMMSGILQADSGDVMICGESVYENIQAKEQIFHLQDKAFYHSGHSLAATAKFYATVYKNFDVEKVTKLNEHFHLDMKKSMKKFSKGMQRQASIMLALAANTEILLLDESFDGLDPMYKKKIKQMIIHELATRDLTVVVTSQNLYDLDGMCDSIVLLHKSDQVVWKTVDEAKETAMKFQVGFNEVPTEEQFATIGIQNVTINGRVASFVVTGDLEKVNEQLNAMRPLFVEGVSLSLEEIFVIEVERFIQRTGKSFEYEEIFQVTTEGEV